MLWYSIDAVSICYRSSKTYVCMYVKIRRHQHTKTVMSRDNMQTGFSFLEYVYIINYYI